MLETGANDWVEVNIVGFRARAGVKIGVEDGELRKIIRRWQNSDAGGNFYKGATCEAQREHGWVEVNIVGFWAGVGVKIGVEDGELRTIIRSWQFSDACRKFYNGATCEAQREHG